MCTYIYIYMCVYVCIYYMPMIRMALRSTPRSWGKHQQFLRHVQASGGGGANGSHRRIEDQVGTGADAAPKKAPFLAAEGAGRRCTIT